MTETKAQAKLRKELEEATAAYNAAGDRYLKSLEPTDEELEDAAQSLVEQLDDMRGQDHADSPGWAAQLAFEIGDQRGYMDEEVVEEARQGWTAEAIADKTGHDVDAVRRSLGRLANASDKAETR